MNSNESTFREEDDDDFKRFITEYLLLGAATQRGMTPTQYVEIARRKWATCEKDDVYAVKLLFDPLVQPQFRDESPDELFCVLVARVGHCGELIDAPQGYKPPNYPGVHLSHVVAGSPSGGHEPDPAEPADYILGYMDVLGFEGMLRQHGVDIVRKLYAQLLETALSPNSEARPWGKALSVVQGEVVPAAMWMPIHTAYFSDSLLLWVHYNPGHVHDFLGRCARVFCEALELGLPLRGAITVGRAVLNKDQSLYLGAPLVEAARLESKLDWIGVALGSSFKCERLQIPIPPDSVMPFAPPMKTGGLDLFSDLVLDWPRTWRESRSQSARDCLGSLCKSNLPDPIKQRYRDAMAFVKYSEENQDWCLPKGMTRIKA